MKNSTAAFAGVLALAMSLPAAAFAANLPVYPGAKLISTQMHKPMTFCGTTMTMEVYQVPGVSAATVAKWYEGRIRGAVPIDLHVDGAGTNIEVFQPDGRAAATASRVNYGSLEGSAKSFGFDHTTLGLLKFDPAVPPDMLDMLSKAARGDAGARARMKARCAGSGE